MNIVHTLWTVTKVVCFALGAGSIVLALAIAVLVIRDERDELDDEFRRLVEEDRR